MLAYAKLLLFLLLFYPEQATSQTDIPEYDFWDDSVFDNIEKTRMNGFERNITNETTTDECVGMCLGQPDCVSLFYNPKTSVCETVGTNLLVNHKSQDSTIRPVPNNRYYRYVPPEAEYCKLEDCFYYNRPTNSCWKMLWGHGPRDNMYNWQDARKACEAEGGMMASMDTLEKLQQVSLMIRNFPLAMNQNGLWYRVYVGAILQGRASVRNWLNGNPVSNDTRFYVADKIHYLKNNKLYCFVLGRDDPTNTYRLFWDSCSAQRLGTVCEKVPPP